MKDDLFKQVYAFALILLTVGWAVFSALLVHHAMSSKDSVDVLAASGAAGLLGALTTWDSLVVQHYFRKARDEGKPPEVKP